MANKKPQNDYLSAINGLLLEEESDKLKANEFTTEMFQIEYEKKFGSVGSDYIYRLLKKKVNSKEMSYRKIKDKNKGKEVNAYSLTK